MQLARLVFTESQSADEDTRLVAQVAHTSQERRAIVVLVYVHACACARIHLERTRIELPLVHHFFFAHLFYVLLVVR